RQGQLAAGQGRIGPWRWPQSFDGYVDRLAPYAPLAEEAASWDESLEVGAAFVDEEIRLTATIPVVIQPPDGAVAQDYEASTGAIGHAVLPYGLPPKLLDL